MNPALADRLDHLAGLLAIVTRETLEAEAFRHSLRKHLRELARQARDDAAGGGG